MGFTTMKTFINWLFIPLLLLLPAWYRSLKDAPKLPPGVKVADAANRTKTAAVVAEEEAAVARGAAARAMSARGMLTGAGLIATVGFLLWPEISDSLKKPARQSTEQESDQRRFERQARAAQDVTASEDDRDDRDEPTRSVSREEDERISAQKDYRGDPGWRARNSSERNVVCRWVPIDWEWEEYRCHDYFERPITYPRGSRGYQKPQRREPKPQFVRYGPNMTACRRGGCPYNGG